MVKREVLIAGMALLLTLTLAEHNGVVFPSAVLGDRDDVWHVWDKRLKC